MTPDHVPFAYALVAASVLAAAVSVIRAWTWARGEMRTLVLDEMRRHEAHHQRLDDAIGQLVRTIERLPCVRKGFCDDRSFGESPAVTPLGLPVVPPRTGTE